MTQGNAYTDGVVHILEYSYCAPCSRVANLLKGTFFSSAGIPCNQRNGHKHVTVSISTNIKAERTGTVSLSERQQKTLVDLVVEREPIIQDKMHEPTNFMKKKRAWVNIRAEFNSLYPHELP